MSIQLYIGHSGQRLRLDPAITTLENLKVWLEDNTNIAARSQILLTAQGKQVRAQNLLTESELFVFDSRLFTNGTLSRVNSADDSIESYRPDDAPDTITDQNDLQAWQHLFALRKSWARGVLLECTRLADRADSLLDEEYIIARSVGVAVASLQQHVRSSGKKYNTVATWADEVIREQDAHLQAWEQNLGNLKRITARPEFSRFVHVGTTEPRRMSQATTNLQDFVDAVQLRKAASSTSQWTDELNQRLTTLQSKVSTAASESDDLLQRVEQFQSAINKSPADSDSEPVQLRKEIEIIVRKVSTDLEHVQSLPRTSQSISQASKMALLSTRNYLPNLSEYCNEMNELVHTAHQRKSQASEAAIAYMQALSGIESKLADIYAETSSFTLSDDHQQNTASLAILTRLPSVYGQLLVESVRRREWVAKMKRDSAVLQEEMAVYQEEEEKRRRKWMRSMEDVVSADAIDSTRALGIELSLQNEGGSWPMVTRQELTEYMHALSQVYGQNSTHVEEMDLAIKDLDKPTRKQIKRAKAFKNGSMHETAFGDTSLMLRGEEQHKALRDSNQRLEEDLKASKSRVRKLEDLLHRSTQASRPASDMFTPHSMGDRRITPPHFPTSNVSGELSPSSSNRHRRLSSNLGIEEKKLARRVVDLEAELQTFRDDAASRKNSDADAKRQIDEANSTKKDLMENMEAQQREFATERRNLEVDLREAKDRLEEVEAEMERLVGSRDDERTGIGAKLLVMEEEMTKLKEDAAGHAARAATEQDARSGMEKKLQVAEQARASAVENAQSLRLEQELTREAQTDQLERLAAAHSHLAPNVTVPTTVAGLCIALEELSRHSESHAKDLEEAIAFARSENEALQTTIDNQKQELASLTHQQSEMVEDARRLRERMSAEEARSSSLQHQIEDGEGRLRDLRGKFADGETGADVLRHRVAEEEARAGTLTSQLAEAKSHVNSLDVELMRQQKSFKEAQDHVEILSNRLEQRGDRAKDVSQKLYAHNARMIRLLERLGLAISYQDETMIIERASKLGASTTITDVHNSLSRTTSRTSPPPTRKSSGEDSADLSMLRWSTALSREDEAIQFDAFNQHLSRFNIDTFADAIVKRVRDFEYTAKKYNKEAKESTKRADAYKERSARLRGEASAKVAVKDFKEGDLALFLPTRGQAKGAWAAFNIGCPHYFLAEKEGMRLASRDFIVARISKVEQKTVDLSKTLSQKAADGRSFDDASEAPSVDDDNPFDLSDGLTWWMVHASEERVAGAAPTTPGLGKSTVAAANVDARGSIRVKRGSKGDDASKHLNKSLDSRRSSSNSKRSVAGTAVPVLANAGSPGAQPTAETIAARQRSGSQASGRVPPAVNGGIASGLGIVSSTNELDDVQPLHEQVQKALRPDILRAQSSDTTPDKRRVRSTSPSKSIRSLRRHLSPSPAKPTGKAWDNLFAADFTLQSPTKGDKS